MEDKKWKHVHSSGAGAVYGLGLIGALVYFLQHSTSLQEVVIGIFWSLIWPGVLVYKAFELLKL